MTRFLAFLRFCWRLLLAFVQVGVLLVLVLLLVSGWLYYHYGRGLPDPRAIAHYHAPETTRIYARDGHSLLYELVDPHGGRRTVVASEQIPTILKEATIAVEDANFYEHPGVDIRGILRAMWLNYRHQEIVSGGSTITQQLVRAILLPRQQGHSAPPQRYEDKLREAILAYRVSQEYSKAEILNLYLNEVPYGAQAYGVEAAAQTYFNKHVWQLSEPEATLLAGLPQLPSRYNPRENLSAARARQRITLNLMAKHGYLSSRRANEIFAQPITLVTPTVAITAPHAVFYVRDILEHRYPQRVLYGGGLHVITSIDPHWQQEAQRIARQHIADLRPRNAHNAAVVILSPQGEILAMVGSVDYNDTTIGGQVNVALAPRQPGSALKPIVYAAALQRGWTPATIIWDVPTLFDQGSAGGYAPQNYDNQWHGPQRLRMALANSLNIPAVKALEFVGIEPFVGLATRMGITTFDNPSRYGLSMALGSNEVRLLDLTAAYNTLRNGGHYQQPVAIIQVENNRGELLERQPPQLEPQVIGPHGEPIAYLISDILSDNQARWYMFGRGNVMELPDGRPAAVKTGTSNDWRDSWAVGYTPDVTIGVWVGNNDNAPMHEIAGANGAGLIWRDLMARYHEGRPHHPFPRPQSVVEQTVCAGTGTLPDPSCPHTIRERFVAGMGPPPPDIEYKTVRVAGDGSCLAASYSPPQEVREVRFAIYPPEFREWAAQSGIPQPPTRPCPQPVSLDEVIAMFQPVGDEGIVRGSQAFIKGIARYAYILDVGSGEAPQTWQVINRGTSGVVQGLIGVWHLEGQPPGLYTLRLRVTMPDGLVVEARHIVQYEGMGGQ
jgi:penicillin-binding protein 1C